MTELQLGSYMDQDPWGRSHAAFDSGKRRGLIAGGYKGILCYHKGDEKYHQKVYRTSHGAVSRNVCVTCRATNNGDMVYTAHGVNANHRATCLSTEEFITGVCGTKTWVSIPGWHVGMLCYDWLHVVDLTVIPEVAASCLVELTEESTFGHASTADERLRLAFVAFTKACKKAGVRNRGQMFSMLLGSCGSFFWFFPASSPEVFCFLAVFVLHVCSLHHPIRKQLYPNGAKAYPTLAQKHFNAAEPC